MGGFDLVRKIVGGLQVVAALVFLALIVGLLAGTLPAFFGGESFVVYSGSMEPAIAMGDLTVVMPAKPSELRPGEIITYRTADRPDVIVTHRLIEVGTDDQGRLLFQTKGDANVAVDFVGVDPQTLLGQVVYSIPYVGYVVDLTRQTEGKVLLIGMPALLLALDCVLALRRRQQKVTSVRSEAGELVARGRIALQNGGLHAALGMFDRAIAADPHLDEAWLLKVECLPEGSERLACLRAGLTVNPGSARLRRAVELHSIPAATAVG